MSIDVSQLSQEDLVTLRALLTGATDSFGLDALGRSPIRDRQLTNLNLPPRADDPRPTFFWSAESPRNGGDLTKTKPYPRLMWSPAGVEVTAPNLKAQETYTAQGYVLLPPADQPAPDPVDDLTAALDALSDADRKALFASVQASRIAALQEKMSALTDEQIAAIVAAASDGTTPEGAPEKRGPGRPRKEV